jgi:hypothetical protein
VRRFLGGWGIDTVNAGLWLRNRFGRLGLQGFERLDFETLIDAIHESVYEGGTHAGEPLNVLAAQIAAWHTKEQSAPRKGNQLMSAESLIDTRYLA